MLRVAAFSVVSVVVFLAACDRGAAPPAAAPAPAQPNCMVISRPTSSVFVGGGLRRAALRPACVAFSTGVVAWVDDTGGHVDIDGRTIDVTARASPLQVRPCLTGVALGSHVALIEGVDGPQRVDALGAVAVTLPATAEDERITSINRAGDVMISNQRKQVRVANLAGPADTTALFDIQGETYRLVGRRTGSVLAFDDGGRIDVGFVPEFVDVRGGVVVARAGRQVRGYIDGALVLDSTRERVVSVSRLGIYVSRDGKLLRLQKDGPVVVVDHAVARTVAGEAIDGAREVVEYAVDPREFVLVRERLRGFDCGARDVLTFVDDHGAHVVADVSVERARTNIGFFRGAPAWVESTLSYEPLADVSGTSDP